MGLQASASIPLVVAAVLALTPGVAASPDQDGTEITSLSVAELPGSQLHVSGVVTFRSLPKLVGEDPEGDVLVSGVGADIVGFSIKADPLGVDVLTLTIHIADMIEETGGIPEFNSYVGSFSVSREGVPASRYAFRAFRSAQSVKPGSIEPVFQYGEVGVAWNEIPGRMGDGKIEFDLPLTSIGAMPGAVITNTDFGAIRSFGQPLGLTGPGLDALEEWGPFVVPDASVQLGIGSVDAEPSDIPLTTFASLTGDGSFSGTLSTEGLSGPHLVAAKACYGDWNCHIRAVAIMI